MDQNLQKMLDQVIEEDEGGWMLSENKDDPDGGWTYAGMTAKTFYAWHKDAELVFDHDHLAGMLQLVNFKRDFQNTIRQCYDEVFLNKIPFNQLPLGIHLPLISCAINCGAENAIKILQETMGMKTIDGVCGPNTIDTCKNEVGMWGPYGFKIRFCKNWMKYYINLVEKNAEEWRQYALWIQGKGHNMAPVNIPKVLCAANLKGWFNRVERYRTYE
jgi:lysozyme family protein